jgi:hypothetical protein
MDYEALLLQSLSKDQLEEQVTQKIAQFHGLLTRDVATRLLAKEKGLVKEEEEKLVTIGGIAKGSKKVLLEARVKKIWPIAEYRSGKRSRVVEVEDGTGSIPLILWNEDVKLANGLRTKDRVRVKGAYERNGELNLGYAGAIELLERTPFSSLGTLAKGEYAHVQGFVSRVEGLDRYVSGTSAHGGFSFYLSDGKADVQVVIWGRPERGKILQAGDEVILENALEKDGRLELSEDARILTRRKERMLLGKVEAMEAEGERLKVRVGGKEASFDRENAMRFMGADVAEDIALSTLITLKKDYLLNTSVAVRIKEKEGRMIVER